MNAAQLLSRIHQPKFRLWAFGVRGKLSLMLIVVTLGVVVITSMIGIRTTNRLIQQAGQEKLKTDVQLGLNLFENQHDGNWSNTNHQLWKGDIEIAQSGEVIKALSVQLGDAVGIFSNQSLIAFSYPGLAELNISTFYPPTDTLHTVLQLGNTVTERITVGTEPFEATFVPIRDNQDRIVGMWAIGVPLRNLEQQKAAFLAQTITLGIGALVLAIVIGLFAVSRSLSPLNQLVASMKLVGTGDLTTFIRARGEDEVGQLTTECNRMIDSLQRLIREIASGSQQVIEVSEQVLRGTENTRDISVKGAATAKHIANLMREQAGAIEQGVKSMALVEVQVESIAETTRHMSGVAEHVSQTAHMGATSVHAVGAQMELITERVGALCASLQTLETWVGDIKDISVMIQGIANQTNLVSLNAAIEAASAGEAGRGFSVVADEVRKLAIRCRESTIEVSELTERIGGEVSTVKSLMSLTGDEVAAGQTTVAQVDTAFSQIHNSIRDVVGAIATASGEMTVMTNQMDGLRATIGGMSAVTEQTAEAMESLSVQSTEQLNFAGRLVAFAQSLVTTALRQTSSIDRFKA